MLSRYCSDPEVLHNNYVKRNSHGFPRLCAAPIGALTSLLEVEKLIVGMAKRSFRSLNAAGSFFLEKQFVKSVNQCQRCAEIIIAHMVDLVFFQIPDDAIRVILSVMSPNTTEYEPKEYQQITKNVQDICEKFIGLIDHNYNSIHTYDAVKYPVLVRIAAIANCVIEALFRVCCKPIRSGLYLKEAVLHFKIRDPRLSLYLVRNAVIALIHTIPAAVFAAPQCLLQCCESLYDPQHVKSINSKIANA